MWSKDGEPESGGDDSETEVVKLAEATVEEADATVEHMLVQQEERGDSPLGLQALNSSQLEQAVCASFGE